MAGPMDLRGRVSVTDGASPVLRRIRGELDGVAAATKRLTVMQNAVGSAQRHVDRATRAGVAAAAGTYAMLGIMRKAEEFNKNIFGVGAAVQTENTERIRNAATGLDEVVVNYEKIAEAMRQVEGISLSLSKELGQTPTRLSGIAEVLAKAGFESEKLAAATRAIGIAAVTDTETPVQKLGEFASVLDTIYKPRAGEKWAEFFARQLDIVRIAAGETRLSVGSMMEGLRPFSALYALLGNDEATNAMLLMAGVKKGGEATEVGHTLKSNAVRFMRMTAEGASTFSALGLRRGDYTDLSALDPTRAAGNLGRAFRGAGIQGKFRADIEKDIQKAIAAGTFGTDKFQDALMAKVAKAAKVDLKDQVSRERFEERFQNAIFGAGMRVDMLKLMHDLMAKGATPAQLATIFEGRRIGTITQIMEGLREFGPEYMKKLGLASGQNLEATKQIYTESNYGKLLSFFAALERFQIKLANSDGLMMVVQGLTTVIDALGNLPKPLQDIGVAAGLAAAALVPLGLAIGAIGVALGPLKWLGGLFSKGAPAAAAGTGATVAGAAGVAAAGAAGAAVAARSGILDRLRRYGMTAGKGVGYMLPGVGQGLMLKDIIGAGGRLIGGIRAGGWRAGMLVPGLGTALAMLGLGMSIYSGVQKYRETGSALEGLKEGSGFNDAKAILGWLFGGTSANAATPGKSDAAGTGPKGAAAPAEAESAAVESMRRIRAAVSSMGDLTSEGQRMMQTLAAGIRAGAPEVERAMGEAMGRVRAAARVSLPTGPSMGAPPQSPLAGSI